MCVIFKKYIYISLFAGEVFFPYHVVAMLQGQFNNEHGEADRQEANQ